MAGAQTSNPTSVSKRALSSRRSFYVWVGVVLAIAVAAVILGWHADGGTPDPSDRTCA